MGFASLNPSYKLCGKGPRLLARRTPVSPPIPSRLIGDARVIAAIRKALDRLAAAECKFRIARVADRPAAFAVAELEERAALPHRNNVLGQIRLGREIKIVDGRQRSVAAHGRTDAQHG